MLRSNGARKYVGLKFRLRNCLRRRKTKEAITLCNHDNNMAKRPAEEPLESISYRDSPSTKKVRVELAPEGDTRSNGFSPSSAPQFPRITGREFEEDARNGRDILAAADQLEEELQEAAPTPPSDNEDGEAQSAFLAPSRQAAPVEGYTDLYLDTINRSVLDFDFEKLCSVTLSNINVYACLVCGKYFQGRGPKSHAYFHALEIGHHVYVNMQTKKVFVLPEGYEVKSKSLDDIKFVVDPRLSKEEVAKLDREAKDAWDLGGKKYRPGMLWSYHVGGSSDDGSRLCGNEQHQGERLLQRHHTSPRPYTTTPQLSHARGSIPETRASPTVLGPGQEDMEHAGFQVSRLAARAATAGLQAVAEKVRFAAPIRSR